MAAHKDRVEGVLLRGMTMADIRANKVMNENVRMGSFKDLVPGTNTVAIGARLAEALGVQVGDSIALISPRRAGNAIRRGAADRRLQDRRRVRSRDLRL